MGLEIGYSLCPVVSCSSLIFAVLRLIYEIGACIFFVWLESYVMTPHVLADEVLAS